MDQPLAIAAHSDAAMAAAPRATWKSVTADYVNLTKPGITFSNMLTTFTGLWLAGGGRPNLAISLLTLAGSSLVVMSGCALNNYIDRDIDQFMKRTQKRPLPSGRLRPANVIVFGGILGLLGIGLLAVLVNALSAVMALIGLFFYVIVYTGLTKRTTTLSTVIGGISGAMPPLIGWTAITGSLGVTGWILFGFMFLWQPPHFLALGIRRAKEYGAAGIPLLPVVYGFKPTMRQIVVWTLMLVPSSLLLYPMRAEGLLYLVVAVILGALYIVKALRGLTAKDEVAWATDMFKYSLVYLTVMSIAMIVLVK